MKTSAVRSASISRAGGGGIRIREITGDATPDSAASSVEYRDVTKIYAGSAAPAVEELSLRLPAGEICVLVGPSGCGKTTAMRMANRTVEITRGEILIGERSVSEISPARLRREIGYVIQQIGLFPHRTIGQNIATVPRLLGWKRDRIEDRITELLALIGLDPELRDRYPAQLSGGQQQRVGVARALAADPGVMLMDEPFGAVDPINRERIQNEFLRLQGEIGKTILFVTHDIDEAIKMGDRIAILREGGRLAQFATPAELLMAPADEFVESFVGSDRALKRLALMRVRDIDLWQAPLVRAGEPAAAVRERTAAAEVPYALMVNAEQRPLGWVSARELLGERVPEAPHSAPGPVLDRDDVMRDALSDLLREGVQFAPVVDSRGRVTGILSVEIISDFLASPASADAGEADESASAVAPETEVS